MPYQPIENYGIIGNMRTVALVGMNGSIDWHCSPNFDSPSIFGALLDDQKGGRFQIAPLSDQVRRKQFYWPSTNILVTRRRGITGLAVLSPASSPRPLRAWRRQTVPRLPSRLQLRPQPA